MGFSEVVVYGAGALGSCLGARLAAVRPTRLIARPAHAAAIREHGLRLGGLVDETVRHVAAETSLAALGPDALVLLTTKIADAPRAARELAPRLRPETLILCLQNGLGVEREVAAALAAAGRPEVRVRRGVASTGAVLVAPGKIEYWGGSLLLAAADPEAPELAALFQSAGIETALTDDLPRELWWKLAVNCVVNPLTALFCVRNREVGGERLAPVRHAVVAECRAVAAAEGVALPETAAAEIDAAILKSNNRSSMLQDLDYGRPTEIEELNGLLVRLAERYKLAAPVNATLAALVRERVRLRQAALAPAGGKGR